MSEVFQTEAKALNAQISLVRGYDLSNPRAGARLWPMCSEPAERRTP